MDIWLVFQCGCVFPTMFLLKIFQLKFGSMFPISGNKSTKKIPIHNIYETSDENLMLITPEGLCTMYT